MAPVQPNASVAATGLGIRYISNWAYAYSGQIDAKTSAQTMLDFTTGSGLIVGTFNVFGLSDFGTPQAGGKSAFQLLLNDVAVAQVKMDTAAEYMPTTYEFQIVVPPFTHVQLKVDSAETTTAEFVTAIFSGRVYGAE